MRQFVLLCFQNAKKGSDIDVLEITLVPDYVDMCVYVSRGAGVQTGCTADG